jgi:signal transduction histidine kinase
MMAMMALPDQPLKTRFKLGMTQRFLLFFFVTAIVPIVVMGGLFLHRVREEMDERRDTLIRTGQQLTRTILLSDLERLGIAASQAALVWANQAYLAYLTSGDAKQLEVLLNRLQQSKSLDIVALVNVNGDAIASSNYAEDSSSRSFKAVSRAALTGKTVFSVERFKVWPHHRFVLHYIAAVPVRDPQKPRIILGALVLGQSVAENFSFQKLSETLPELDVRIFQKDVSTTPLIFSSIAKGVGGTPPPWTIPNHRPFTERIGREEYRSLRVALLNFYGEPVGQVLISTPVQGDLWLEEGGGLFFILFYILLGLVGIGFSGWWFHRSFVHPLHNISLASSAVAQGDLTVHVPDQFTQNEIRLMVQNFNRMIRQLRMDEQLRNSFISSLTHDLRTPLLAERRVFELFQEFSDELSPQFQKLTQNLSESNDHLLQMVNNLLETFKYEAGRETLVLRPVHLPTLVSACLSRLAPLATANQVRLHQELPEDFPLIEADESQLERVFNNLVGNAIENIRPVGDQIWIRGATLTDGIEIRIVDNGPGLPREIRENLFERYAAGGYRTQKIGSGLGLYICKMIVERHGGKISLDSSQAPGTTFILQLQRRLSPLQAPVGAHEEGKSTENQPTEGNNDE